MEKRGAIGLSINVLVVVIISIVLLGLGITLLYQFIGGAGDIKRDLDQRTNQELERLLVNQGERVALPLHTAIVLRGDSHVFGIGVLNIGGVDNDFYVNIEEPEIYVDEFGEVQNVKDDQNLREWLLFNTDVLKIEEGEHRKESILVTIPDNAPTGEYIFSTKVCTKQLCDGDSRYGNPQKFIVVVR